VIQNAQNALDCRSMNVVAVLINISSKRQVVLTLASLAIFSTNKEKHVKNVSQSVINVLISTHVWNAKTDS
jgi:hypothetical protein